MEFCVTANCGDVHLSPDRLDAAHVAAKNPEIAAGDDQLLNGNELGALVAEGNPFENATWREKRGVIALSRDDAIGSLAEISEN